MKKILGILLVVIMVTTISGCGKHVHKWTDATCTDPKTCQECGETEGEALGHKWVDATCTKPRTCSRCGEIEGKELGHVWADASCTKPKTCKVCGLTEGQPLGHEWVDATCTEPKTCSVCGETEGNPLGHDVKGATCTKGGKCSRCGEEMPAAGHKWEDASCTEPKTCSICGLTEGKPLGHTTKSGKCERCGEELFEPYTGTGDDVISDIDVGEGLYRAHIIYTGQRNFVVKSYEGSEYLDLLVNEIGAYEGYVFLDGSTTTYTLVIESSGKWSIELEKLGYTEKESFSGKGDFVTPLFSSDSNTWKITYDGEHNFIVKAYSSDGRDLLVNEIGEYDGTVYFAVPEDSYAFFEINAEGKWRIEPK